MKFTRIPVKTGPSGNEISVPVYFFKGKRAGAKKAYLQSSIHGAELQGNAVIHQLIEFFKAHPPTGDVTLVPLANPNGMDRKTGEYTDGRFDPVTGENWNRAYYLPDLDQFQSGSSVSDVKAQMVKIIEAKLKKNLRGAERLALTLQRMAVQADVVLDLHNANVSGTYLYAADTAIQDALYFGFSPIILMPATFGGSLDEAILVPWAKLQKPLLLRPDEVPQGYTLELGNQEQISFELGRVQTIGILEFLKHKGIVSGRAQKPKTAIVGDIQDYIVLYAEAGGLYEYVHPVGKVAIKGTVLATRLNFGPSGGKISEVKTAVDFLPTLHYASSAVGQGDELWRGFTRWRSVKPHTSKS